MSEETSLISTDSGSHLEDDIFVVIGILGEECYLDCFFELRDALISDCNLRFHHLEHLWILLIGDESLDLIVVRIELLVLTVELYRVLH